MHRVCIITRNFSKPVDVTTANELKDKLLGNHASHFLLMEDGYYNPAIPVSKNWIPIGSLTQDDFDWVTQTENRSISYRTSKD